MDIFVFINITAFSYAEFNRVNFISLTRVFCVSFLFSLHLHYIHMHGYVNKKNRIFLSTHFFKKLLSFQTCFQAPIYKAFERVCFRSYKIELSDQYYIYVWTCGASFFLWMYCTRSLKTIHYMNTWSNAHDPMYVGVVIYKNVRACSINVVMAMLWKNAFNNACWKMFQHNNKYMNVIWLKPLTVRCGGSCMIQILNPESALGMDQISRYPPIFRKFFAFRGTAWGV